MPGGSATEVGLGFGHGPTGGDTPTIDSTTGLYQDAVDKVQVAINGVEKMKIDANGVHLSSTNVLPSGYGVKTGGYAVQSTDSVILMDVSGGSGTCDLPLISSTASGRILEITKVDNSANYVTVTPSGSDLIGPLLTKILAREDHCIKIMADANVNEWRILADSDPDFVYEATASATVADPTTAQTSIIGTGIGSTTLQANLLVPGMAIKLKGHGVYGRAATAETINFRLKFGSTVLVSTGVFTPTASMTNREWVFEATITCRTTGTTGTVFVQGFMDLCQDPAVTLVPHRHEMSSTTTVTVDTEATQVLDFTADWTTTAAGDTFTCTNFTATLV